MQLEMQYDYNNIRNLALFALNTRSGLKFQWCIFFLWDSFYWLEYVIFHTYMPLHMQLLSLPKMQPICPFYPISSFHLANSEEYFKTTYSSQFLSSYSDWFSCCSSALPIYYFLFSTIVHTTVYENT